MEWLQALIIAAAAPGQTTDTITPVPGWLQALIIAAAALGGLGVFFLMPRGSAPGRNAGIGLAAAGLVLLWVIWSLNLPGTPLSESLVFYLLATPTVVAGVMTVTQRNPVSCALWFASVVIGTASLFMLQNAQFLAAASVIVYAGAIVVMFLFVIMLAQQAGAARHDRLSREPGLAVAASFVLIVALVSTIIAVYREAPDLAGRPEQPTVSAYLDPQPDSPHVASLGTALFADHWLSLEVAGTLLLVAMVAAIAIAARRDRA